ncbi:pentapeptide repeat-containing protein [Nannocystis sp. ILAH1]|uniref:pentapeptide repeat-containing protein n=1 Tax=Nannocystis sp. ILAH1 TaxID=2996789 RepID=UPI002270E891|nr:pentapeptide repeat-containing protein [Nannocystis sp. ILAH1]MCY0988046.1 pentapeptide repeat-containing protein [Nannocystis sp. ILAH1]
MPPRRDYGASRFNAPGTFTAVGFSPDSRGLEALVIGQGASRWLTFAVDTGAITARRDLDGEWRDLRVLPDGGLLVSTWGITRRLSPAAATVWSVTGEQRLRLAAVSPDGAACITFIGATAEVRDCERGRVVHTLHEAEGDLYAFAFSRDGRWLATGSSKGVVRLYDARTWAELGKRKSTQVLALAFSPAGDHLLVGHGNGKVELWQLPGLKPVRGFVGRHQFDVGGDAGCRWVAFSADGAHAFSLGNEHCLRAWSVPGGNQVFHLDVPRRHAQGPLTALSPDGRWIASGSTTGALSVWSAATGEPRVEYAAPAPIEGLALTARTVAAGSSRVCVFWDRATGESSALATTFPPTDIHGLSSGQFVRLDYDKIFVGDAPGDAESPNFELATYASGPIAISRDETRLAAPAQYAVELWDLQRSIKLASLPHAERARACAFGPRDAWLATADDVLHLWRLGASPTAIRDIELDSGGSDKIVRGLAVSARGLIAVSVDASVNHVDARSSILVIDPRDGRTLARLARPGVRLGQVAFVGSRLAVADSAGRLLQLDLSDPAHPRWLETDEVDVFPPNDREELPIAALGDDVAHVGPGGDVVVQTLESVPPELGEPILLAPDPSQTSAPARPPALFEKRLAGARFLFAGRFKNLGTEFREATVPELGGEIASKPDARVTHLALGDRPSAAVLKTLGSKRATFETLSEAALAQLLLPTAEEARALLRGEVKQAAERWNTWRRRYSELGGERFPVALQGIDLAGADLRAYALKVVDLTAANLAGADLRGVDVFDVVFRNADLSGADFTGGKCYRTIFSGAKLTGARLGAMLAGARFDGAELTDADLRDADLQYVDFSGADLRRARLPKSLTDVKHDARTQWPEGVRPK